jgi:HAD superfamily hydrolase (TIGR01484 family)
MKGAFRAIAFDYDGTLTQTDRPSSEVMTMLADARRAGLKLVLVTGRILADLLSGFPEAVTAFDAIVTEDGAVLWCEATGLRRLTEPITPAFEERLRVRGVTLARGDVILATDGRFDAIVLEEITKLGLDYQLVRNRSALMIVPSGTSKGTGLGEALGELGVSPHNVVAIGDAENDHSLLEACEIGVAAGNAIPALKTHADVVLPEANGHGVVRFVHDLLSSSLPLVTPNRWRVPIGTRDDGSPVTLPASGINVLIAGGTGSGKSYLAGLLAERLLPLGYSVCVFDPEGDHSELGHLRGTVTVGGTEGVPTPAQLGRLLHRRFGGAIVDLSLLRPDERLDYTRAALDEVEALRAATGLPHWIFLDEAHAALGEGTSDVTTERLDEKGYCLVTYRPGDLCRAAIDTSDVLFLLPESGDVTRVLFEARRLQRTALPLESAIRTVAGLSRGQALMIDSRSGRTEVITLGARRSTHVRHRHKYVHGALPPRNHFYFRDARGATGRTASNMEDFHRELLAAPHAVLLHHAGHVDFSSWVREVLHDRELALEIRECERADLGPETLRARLIRAIERRYGDEQPDGHGVVNHAPTAAASPPT